MNRQVFLIPNLCIFITVYNVCSQIAEERQAISKTTSERKGRVPLSVCHNLEQCLREVEVCVNVMNNFMTLCSIESPKRVTSARASICEKGTLGVENNSLV